MMEQQKEQKLLLLGIANVGFYWLNLFILAALDPNYSHMRNFVSDLGRVEAPYHAIFNSVIFLLGVSMLAVSTGFYSVVKRMTGRRNISITVAVFVAAFGINFIFGGLYPLPDIRHAAFGIGALHFFTPLILIWAFWRIDNTKSFKSFQLISFFAMLFSMMLAGAPFDWVNESTMGLIQRIGALVWAAWYVSTSYWLLRQ